MEALLKEKFDRNYQSIKQRTTMKAVKVNHATNKLSNEAVLKIAYDAIEKRLTRDSDNVQGWMKQLNSDFNIRFKYVVEDLFQANLAIQEISNWRDFILGMRSGEVKQDGESMNPLQMVIRLTRELQKDRLNNQRRILSNTNLHNSTGYLHNAENLWVDSFQKMYILWLTDMINLIVSSMALNSSLSDHAHFCESISGIGGGVF